MRVYQNDERISMDEARTDSGPAAMVERLRLASNDHDIEAVEDMIAEAIQAFAILLLRRLLLCFLLLGHVRGTLLTPLERAYLPF